MKTRRVLYVEDDDDIRFLVGELLRDVYDVVAVGSADDALRELQRAHAGETPRIDVVLSDYRLTNASGAGVAFSVDERNADWLVREGRAQGLLENVPVVILSAERGARGIEGLPFLLKPVDAGVLITSLDKAIAQVQASPAIERDHAKLVHLRLYVSASIDSVKAEHRLRDLLARSSANVHLDVFDVTQPDGRVLAAIEEDRVVVTPTLVRCGPGARLVILGDLSRDVTRNRLMNEMLAP